uniref:Uncharacterized protein n=1 Tax=Anguilla anguilla TaxID=7936 RepID=A0A0E9VQX6_ANGAN
MAPKTMRTG